MKIMVSAYEPFTGVRHVLEVKKKLVGSLYAVFLDGEFFTTSESRREGEDEIEALVDWFGWSWKVPV